MKTPLIKRNWFKKITGGISLGAALFVFQACYGPPHAHSDVLVEIKVFSQKTGEPVPNIEIIIDKGGIYHTNENGISHFFFLPNQDYTLTFKDIDSTLHSTFLDKDTLISVRNESITMTIALEEKE